MTTTRSTSRHPRRLALAWAPIALAAALAAAPATAANRFWTFIGGCASADWVLVSAGPNSQGQLTCWSAVPGGLSGQAAPGTGDDAFITNTLATAPLLVTFAAPGRPVFAGTARDLTMYGSPSFEAGLSMDRYTLSVRNMNLGLASSAFLGRMDQSGGSVTVANELTVLGGSYNLSGGLLNAGAVNLISQLAPAKFTHSGGTLIAAGISVGSTGGPAASFSQLAGVVNNGELAIGVGTPVSGTGSLSISGATTRWTTTGDTAVGVVGKGTLTITDGAHFTGGTARLGLAPASDGRVTVSGTGSQFNLDGLLTVGLGGSGTLLVNPGGSATVGGALLEGAAVAAGVAPATVTTVQGAAANLTVTNTLVVARDRGAGLELKQGGALKSDIGLLGDHTGSSGLVSLSGGSSWTSDTSLIVGNQGRGRVEVVEASRLSTREAALGLRFEGNGTVALSGNGTSWINQTALKVGQGGTGLLTLQSGAYLETQSLVLGELGNSNGTLTAYDGGTSLKVNQGLVVGSNGNGSLGLNAASLVTGQLTLGELPGGRGTVVMNNNATAPWINNGDLIVGLEGVGRLEMTADARLQSSRAVLGSKAGSNGAVLIAEPRASLVLGGPMVVGDNGGGVLSLRDGGQLVSTTGLIGQSSGGVGSVTVNAPSLFGLASSWRMTGDLTVGQQGTGTLTIGGQGLVESAGRTRVGSGSQIVLDGGTLRSAVVDLGDPASLSWRSGTLRVTGAGGAQMDGRSLPFQLDLLAGRTLQVDQTLRLGSDSVMLLSGGRLLAGTLSLDRSVLASTGGGVHALDMAGIGLLTGQGQVAASIVGGVAANRIAATGPLTLGLAARTDGFAFGGTLDLGHQQVVLLDRDLAELGVQTSLGDGAQLVSVNGARLAVGDRLQGDGSTSVQGRFINNGAVVGNTGLLSFIDDVSGSGQFAGNVRFLAGYSPGNSTAQVSFLHGGVSFGANSLLTLEINGDTPGTGFDQLIEIGDLSFDGRLLLAFGSNFSAAPGTRLSLLNFDAFQGRLDAAHVQVSGYDVGGLDLSRLSIDGTITITAVPEPSTWAMWLAGLGVFAMRITRPRHGRQEP